MVPTLFPSRFMPCAECGESLERFAAGAHHCDQARRVEYQLFGMRHEVAAFESRLQHYLDTPRGSFERWLAARQVRNTPR